ncbi:hypothetical protein M569_03956, partial [Genlisea aurea]
WCVTNVVSSPAALQGFIDYACGKYDCSAIQQGGPCFEPNTVIDHASYALDLVYKNSGYCDTDIGYISNADPSRTPGCVFP